MRLRAKLISLVLGLSSVVVLYLVLYWFPDNQQRQVEGLHVAISNQVDMLAESLVPLLLQKRLGSIYESLDGFMRAHEEWKQIILRDSEHRVIYPLGETGDAGEDISQKMSFIWPVNFHGEMLGELDIVVDSSPLIRRIYRENGRLALFLGSVLLVTIIAALISLDKIVSGPVRKLLGAVNSLREGDYDAPLPKPGSDEIGGLVKGFESMRNEILNTRRQLEYARDDLEHKVDERTAQLREATEEALSATQAKSEFLSRMSHELRTPLNAILGFGQLLDMKSSEAFGEETRESIREILNAGHHLLYLINEILDLSSIETGQLNIACEPVALYQMVSECIKQIGIALASERNVTLINQISDQDVEIMVDPIRFKQVLINLLSNAVKYNKEGGTVIINAELLDNERVSVSITDTGSGITEADMKRLFDPFDRLSYKNSNIEGTGIGLTVTRQLVEAMGGNIRVDSRVGSGSSFIVDFMRYTGQGGV